MQALGSRGQGTDAPRTAVNQIGGLQSKVKERKLERGSDGIVSRLKPGPDAHSS